MPAWLGDFVMMGVGIGMWLTPIESVVVTCIGFVALILYWVIRCGNEILNVERM